MKATYKKYVLDFKRPSGTSRGIMTQKESWFIVLQDNNKIGIGECGLLKGLSIDDYSTYEAKLKWVCDNILMDKEDLFADLIEYPSIIFGLEQAFLSLAANDTFDLYPSSFTQNEQPIPINGLVWMGDEMFMQEQIQKKLEEGFTCIKMKVGAIDFDKEYNLLQSIRKQFSKEQIILRVDANGAFLPADALEKLRKLADLDIHSIEQPIKQGQVNAMAELCKKTALPIALDEELIGITSLAQKTELLQVIRPQYIILKPSLVGGFKASEQWISIAEKLGIGWWITSALESNIGLNAIAQWTATLNSTLLQGLGTGSLFTNNFESPLEVSNGNLFYRKNLSWQENITALLCT